MRALILAAFVVLSIGSGTAHADAQTYRAPAQNYHQNNWMNR